LDHPRIGVFTDKSEDSLEVPRLDEEEEQTPMALGATAVSASALALLQNIWACPQIMNFMQGTKKVWTFVWCPNESDGTCPKSFLGWHGTKALAHIICIPH
jgi:hypothetical protein